MAKPTNVQMTLHSKTVERLKTFAIEEGIVSSNTEEPIVSQAISRIVKAFLDIHEDPDWKRVREQRGGTTFSVIDIAVKGTVKRRDRGNY